MMVIFSQFFFRLSLVGFVDKECEHSSITSVSNSHTFHVFGAITFITQFFLQVHLQVKHRPLDGMHGNQACLLGVSLNSRIQMFIH